jgi:hypothetical protein
MKKCVVTKFKILCAYVKVWNEKYILSFNLELLKICGYDSSSLPHVTGSWINKNMWLFFIRTDYLIDFWSNLSFKDPLKYYLTWRTCPRNFPLHPVYREVKILEFRTQPGRGAGVGCAQQESSFLKNALLNVAPPTGLRGAKIIHYLRLSKYLR